MLYFRGLEFVMEVQQILSLNNASYYAPNPGCSHDRFTWARLQDLNTFGSVSDMIVLQNE